MAQNLSEDVRTVTDLKRHTNEILQQIKKTRRPIVLTANGKADAVILDAKSYESYLRARNLLRLLIPAEQEIAAGQTRPMREFLKEFKRAHKISR